MLLNQHYETLFFLTVLLTVLIFQAKSKHSIHAGFNDFRGSGSPPGTLQTTTKFA
jgi:hypothetical protein